MSRRLADSHRSGWALSAPAIAGLLLFVALPFVIAVVLSFTNYRLNNPLPTRWVGLEHYRALLGGDQRFVRALINVALFAIIVVPLQTALALMLAMALNRQCRGIAFVRSAFFIPVVYPMALVAVVWQLLYAPGPDGAVNALIERFSAGSWSAAPGWSVLDGRWTALPAIIALSIWQGVGFQTVILLAGLQAVPTSLYEAAAIDGAGAWQRFRNVTLPGMWGPLSFTMILTAILALRLFDQVRILTPDGGPGLATTTVMLETVRSASAAGGYRIGRASAMAVIFFVLVILVGLIPSLLRQWQLRRGA